MAKTIKNYTSTIPASTSIARIEDMLVEAGARDIQKSYNNAHQCEAIIFKMAVPQHPVPMFFKVPSRVDACFEALWAMYCSSVKKPSPEMKKTLQAQAARTAWKIIHDWVEIQVTMIQLEQAEAMQIFLPYVYSQESQQTFYEVIKEKGFKQLSNG